MPLTNDQIGKKIRDAIRDDAAIAAYCQTKWSKNHSVYYGSTGSKSPPPDKFPVFAVVPWRKERGEDEERRIFTFTVTLQIYDETVETLVSPGGVSYTTFRGPQVLEELLDLAMTAIRAISQELYYDDKTTDYEPIEYFPEFLGSLTLTVSYPILIGGYEPSLT